MPDSRRQTGLRPPDAANRQDALPIDARRHPFVAHVERQLRFRCRLDGAAAAPATLVVGASGGADSTALLLACTVISRHTAGGEARIVPVAAHVHHHLRDSADEDAAWVKRLCDRLGVEVHVEHVRPRDMEGNLAANARALRYGALIDVARRVGARNIAVAHHGDDQLETVLMALGRGAGLEGLTGMPWRRELDDGRWLLRPLLDARRHECEAYCRAAGIQWREDPGNLDPNSARARIRHEVCPVLEALWPDTARRVTAASDLVEAAKQGLAHHLNTIFGPAGERSWSRHELRGVPAPFIAAGLRRAALDAVPGAGDDIGQKHLLPTAEAILDDETKPRSFGWPQGLTVIVNSKRVEMKRES